MATITKEEALHALRRLGELAAAAGETVDLLHAFDDLWEATHEGN